MSPVFKLCLIAIWTLLLKMVFMALSKWIALLKTTPVFCPTAARRLFQASHGQHRTWHRSLAQRCRPVPRRFVLAGNRYKNQPLALARQTQAAIKLITNNSMSTIKLFETSQVRSQWDAEKEAWFFSIVDVIAVLTDSPKARTYWSVLKNRLKKEGSELATNCSQLKMQSADGKNYLTDVADTEQLLRLIQSIPSPKAEPFKQWLARVGYERIEETDDPELAFDRAMATYLKKGYSKAWSGLSTRQYRQNKDLKKESLRDHMTT